MGNPQARAPKEDSPGVASAVAASDAEIFVPMTDLRSEYESLRTPIDAAIRRVIDSARFVQGEDVDRFESEFAAYVGVQHAVGVGSGTAALQLAFLACEIGPGDEVITAPNTDSPTAAAISHTGARVVFVDTDPETFNIDPAAIEQSITPRTKAIVPVHMFGNPAPMTEILTIAERHRLLVIEDAALAVGASLHGQRVGSFGIAGCFSLAPSKILGGFGDAGIVTTNDAQVANRLRVLGNYGHALEMKHEMWGLRGIDRWDVTREGHNERLDELQAAILRVKLAGLEDRIDARRRTAARLDAGLAELPIEVPRQTPGGRHVFMAYTVLLDDRNGAREHLAESGISTRLYYTPPLHLQAAYRHLGYRRGDFPVTERIADRMLSLPVFPSISESQVDCVLSTLTEWLRRRNT